jgi:DNA-binding NarL/FixJ family response regulator
MSKIKVLFLSAQPAVLTALVSFFLNDPLFLPDFEDYHSFNDLMKNASKQYGVIVFDDGSLSSEEMKKVNEYFENNNRTKKILYTGMTEKSFLQSFINSGIDGLVSKKAKIEELKEAIIAVMNRRKYYCDTIIQIILKEDDHKNNFGNSKYNLNVLSKKEDEILFLIGHGLKNKDIAQKLFTSTRTIETHKRNMLKKLNLISTTELICLASKEINKV